MKKPLNPVRREGLMPMYLTVTDFCQLLLVVLGAVGAVISIIRLMMDINKKK